VSERTDHERGALGEPSEPAGSVGHEPPPGPLAEGAEEQGPPRKKHSFFRELPVLIVVAFVVALLIKSFLLQAFYIPSASMEPKLPLHRPRSRRRRGLREGSRHPRGGGR
jgi:signal peptidase I